MRDPIPLDGEIKLQHKAAIDIRSACRDIGPSYLEDSDITLSFDLSVCYVSERLAWVGAMAEPPNLTPKIADV